MMRYAFIGAGRLGSAMIEALIQKGACQPGEIGCISEPDDTARQTAEKLGVHHVRSIRDLVSGADTIVLAVKPQQLNTLDPSIGESSRGKLVISVVAGTRLARLETIFPQTRNIVRTMPNTPARIGAGMTAYCCQHPLQADDLKKVSDLLSAMGKFIAVDESQLDAVTAVSGSGPAYVFEFVAALRNAGVEAGLDPDTSYQLALETVLGSARLLARLKMDPEALRDEVTSPKGTTLAALQVMEKAGFRSLIRSAVLAARNRSVELSAEG
ncbi:MAG: pyrroline-5-carboxylate reductase [Opitutaceae bacterium]